MSDARILLDSAYLDLELLKTLDLHDFSQFNSPVEYSNKAILNIPTCD